MMPHLAETCWQALGHKTLVVETPWPKHDPALTNSDTRHHRRAGQRQAPRRGQMPKEADNKAVEAAAWR